MLKILFSRVDPLWPPISFSTLFSDYIKFWSFRKVSLCDHDHTLSCIHFFWNFSLLFKNFIFLMPACFHICDSVLGCSDDSRLHQVSIQLILWQRKISYCFGSWINESVNIWKKLSTSVTFHCNLCICSSKLSTNTSTKEDYYRETR